MSASMVFNFGKHKTKTFQYVFENHPDYVQWASEQQAKGQLKAFADFCVTERASSGVTAVVAAERCSRCRQQIDFAIMSEVERREYGMTAWCHLCQDLFFHGGPRSRPPRHATRDPLEDKSIHIALKLGDGLLFCTGTSSKVFAKLTYQEALEWVREVWQSNQSFQREPVAFALSAVPKSMHLIWKDELQYDVWDPLTAGTREEKHFTDQKGCKITVEDLMLLQALIFNLDGDTAEPRSVKHKRKRDQGNASKKKKS